MLPTNKEIGVHPNHIHIRESVRRIKCVKKAGIEYSLLATKNPGLNKPGFFHRIIFSYCRIVAIPKSVVEPLVITTLSIVLDTKGLSGEKFTL
jgi:hypothetical protein